MTGGFSETQLDVNVFRVQFNGNGYTSGERAADFTLLRSAELARQHGYRYFVIVQSGGGYSYSAHTTPTQTNTTASATTYGGTTNVSAHSTTYGGDTYVIAKPSAVNTIVCFVERPNAGMVYNADFLFTSLTQKYGIISEYAQTPQPPVGDGKACSADKDCDIGQWCGRQDEGRGRGACIPIGQR
jgi:hypothetical protein